MRWFLRVISIILIIVWMGFIFLLSNQTAEVSSQTSGGVIELIAEKIYPNFENLTDFEKEKIVSSLQFIVRKSAHVGIFAVLGLLAFLVFISYTELRFFTRTFWAVLIGVVYAASDEYHQRFVVGRSCELRDFLLDISGVVLAVLFCTAFVKTVAPLRRKTAFAGKTKREIENLNIELEDKLSFTAPHNESSEMEIEFHKEKLEVLEGELINQLIANEEIKETESVVEETVIMEKNEIKLTDEMEYAAVIIGEVVVEVTKLCNKLADGQDEQSKELINLALGRTEVFKAEILKILNGDSSFEEKKNLIQSEKQETYDYFNSIIAQTC